MSLSASQDHSFILMLQWVFATYHDNDWWIAQVVNYKDVGVAGVFLYEGVCVLSSSVFHSDDL